MRFKTGAALVKRIFISGIYVSVPWRTDYVTLDQYGTVEAWEGYKPNFRGKAWMAPDEKEYSRTHIGDLIPDEGDELPRECIIRI